MPLPTPALFGYHAGGVLVAFAIAAAPLAAIVAVARCRLDPLLKTVLVVGLSALWLCLALPYAFVCLAFSQEGPPFI